MLKEEVFYHLSLLSYYDYQGHGSVVDMIRRIEQDEAVLKKSEERDDAYRNLQAVRKIPKERYEDMLVQYCYNDNLNSGLVFYIISCPQAQIVAFRGSEVLDEINHTTGWQDWSDNVHMFLQGPTYQQLLALHQLQQYTFDRPFYLCGHSKGGNLALYCALCMKEELLQRLAGVYSFNAPGITGSILRMYKERAEEEAFLSRLHLFENEHDCISSFFHHLKSPQLIRSAISCRNIQELYHNHNLYAMDFTDNAYIYAQKKSAAPRAVHHFVNDLFVNQREDRLLAFVERMEDYFQSGLSVKELYRVMLYHISHYIALFDDLPYEDVAAISFQDLAERWKGRNLLVRIKELQPKETLKKVQDMAAQGSAAWNESDIRKKTQELVDSYEQFRNEALRNLQEIMSSGNERLAKAVSAVTGKKEAAEEKQTKSEEESSMPEAKEKLEN